VTETTSLGVGSALSEARRAQGLEIADIAQQLKFMPRQIESLEAERFDSLPGPTIARGMVRTYARFLKIDPEPLLAKMAGHVESRDATPQLAERFNQPVPFSDGGRRSTVVYLALSVVVLAVAGGVLYEWRHERSTPAFVTPGKVAEAQPEEKAAKPAPPPVAEKLPVEKPVPVPPRKVEVASAPKPAAPAPKPMAPAPKPAPVAEARPPAEPLPVVQAPPRNGGPNRLVLRFEEDAWVEVIDSSGRSLVSSLNRAGTERAVRVSPPFNLVVGNASHVKVVYNDKPLDLAPHTKVEVARFTVK
jgi:cytoskeleton protein RodZ